MFRAPNVEAVLAAFALQLMKLVLAFSIRMSGPAAAIKFLLSNSQAGLLIGKGGLKIQTIASQSGASVKVSTSGMYWPVSKRFLHSDAKNSAVLVVCDLQSVSGR
jgi:KH domain